MYLVINSRINIVVDYPFSKYPSGVFVGRATFEVLPVSLLCPQEVI